MTIHLKKICDQRGILIFTILGCLTLVAMLAGVWLRLLALERQQVRTQQNVLQIEYLAESGLNRATTRLTTNAEYDGETWELSPENIGLATPAKVMITVQRDDGNPQVRAITVTAELVTAGPKKVSRRRQQTILLPTKESTP